MAFVSGYLRDHPLPPGIVGALTLSGYQLLVDVAGVGAGRLGQQAFLLVAPDPEPGSGAGSGSGSAPGAGAGSGGDAAPQMTHINLHQPRLGSERDASAYQQLAAQLGYLRLSGYRVALERVGLRSKLNLVNPATGAIALQIPDKHPGKLFGGGANVNSLLSSARSLPLAGPPPDLQSPELLRQTFLALALGDESTTGEQAAELADKALELARGDSTLDPAAALALARRQ